MSNSRRLTKNEKRRLKKKSEALNKETNDADKGSAEEKNDNSVANVADPLGNVEIEYVSADVDNEVSAVDAELADQFRDIFNKFTKAEDLLSKDSAASNDATGAKSATADADASASAPSSSEVALVENGDSAPGKLSKRKKKLLTRLSVAELKQLVPRPDVVEAHDVTASDPKFLIYLKSYNNTVPVPRHWCHIRRYLTGKVGMEKPPFELPEFIAETGIAKIRDTIMEQEALKKAKQKSRERVRPKMGKIDIDYQVLHDAFFKFQTKPKLTKHGDLYYEGKEFETSWKDKKPGHLSTELKEALGMVNPNSSIPLPPPWLINMQRYGPPPSYRSMRIPGLNAPLPPGASYGYQPGCWGKPPVDEYGRPLYGDVFGSTDAATAADEYDTTVAIADVTGPVVVDKSFRWGAIEVEEVSDRDSEAGDGDEKEGLLGDAGVGEDMGIDGMETPSTIDGLGSMASGLETPDTIVDLRKRAGMETPADTTTYTAVSAVSGFGGGTGVLAAGAGAGAGAPKELYKVLEERKSGAAGGAGAGVGQMFGSERTYVVPGKSDVQISLNPDALEETLGDKERLRDAYEQQQQQQQSALLAVPSADGTATEEVSSAAGKASTTKKRKIDAGGGAAKKMKEFKF